MSLDTQTLIQCRRLYLATTGFAGEQSHQILQLRLSEFSRLIILSAGLPPEIVNETAPIQLNNALFHLSPSQLQHPLFSVTQILSSLNIRGAASELINRQIASYIVRMAARNRSQRNFHIVADIDSIIQFTWIKSVIPGSETVILKDAPPSPESVMKKLNLEEEEEEEEAGADGCSICLEEINSKEKEVIKIPCGHVYHKSCIFKWINNNNSCPLCRMPLPLEDSN